ncbi:MAG: hypothetical protein HOO99_03990 [Hyphomicrobiaceae bacterium]|nr:hypothetical protein [Hyphomicrobiaceae bacterium]
MKTATSIAAWISTLIVAFALVVVVALELERKTGVALPPAGMACLLITMPWSAVFIVLLIPEPKKVQPL